MKKVHLLVLPWILLSVLCSTEGLTAQGSDVLSDLASSDPLVRAKASRLLSVRKPGEWLMPDLDRAARSPAEVRQRFLSGLAKNRALFPLLVSEFAKGGPRLEFVRDCLLASYRGNRLPTPLDPTAVEVLPSAPLSLRGVRDLMDLWDRMLVAGAVGLPWILDPRLDREGAAGRQSLLSMADGAYTLRELLPTFENPKWPTLGAGGKSLVTRVRPTGIFIAASAGPESMAEFFLVCLEQYLGTDVASGERAAICLAAMDLPGLGAFFRKEMDGPRRRRALLGLVGEWHRGRSVLDPDQLGPPLLEFYRKDKRWRYLIGTCLRDLLQDRGTLAEWYGKPELQWVQNPVDALIFAGIRLPSKEPWMMKEIQAILQGRTSADSMRTASLFDSLGRLDGPLSGEVRELLVKSVLEGTLQKGSVKNGDVVLARALKLLERRGGDWLPQAPLTAGALGTTRAEGQLWVEQLGKLGEKGWWVRLQTLLSAKEINPALLELASAPAPGGTAPSLGTWSFMARIQAGQLPEGLRAKPGAEALVLMDLGFHLLKAGGVTGRERWKPMYESFDRLLVLVEKGRTAPDARLAPALGKSLGRHLLRLPRGPQGKRAGQWLGGWLADPQTREIGLAASILCLREREHLVRDIDASMTSGLQPLEAVMLRRRLLLASRGRPEELGQEPVDTEDPLLRLGR